jgi:hypothetical protein
MIEEQQQLNKMTRKISSSYQNVISKLIEDCKKEPNKDKRIEILNRINSNLLKPDQLKMTLLSSHLTNDNIDKLLHMLKGKLLLV